MAKAPGAEGWTTPSSRNGVGNPALKGNNANANPSLQDTDTNTKNNNSIKKATSHMEGMQKDGGVPDGKWNAVKNRS